MHKDNELTFWDQEMFVDGKPFSQNGFAASHGDDGLAEISAQLLNIVPCASDAFRRRLEDQLITHLEGERPPNSAPAPSALFGVRCLIADHWFVPDLNLFRTLQTIIWRQKLVLTAAALTIFFALTLALSPTAPLWSETIFHHLRNIMGTPATPETIATALSHPSATPSLTPTPTRISVYPTQPAKMAFKIDHSPKLAIPIPPLAPTPPILLQEYK